MVNDAFTNSILWQPVTTKLTTASMYKYKYNVMCVYIFTYYVVTMTKRKLFKR